MISLSQSPTDPAFVQNPYPFYELARRTGPFFHWTDYNLTCTTNAAACTAIFRDRRFGRESPTPLPIPDHLKPFYAVEAHSMLELEPPRHTRLRSLVLRAFTSRRIAALQPEIATLSHQLIDAFPQGSFDLLPAFATQLPVIIIARLLGVPEAMAPDLLNAGHEATVHTIGNGVKTLLETGTQSALSNPEPTIEEILRFDPALHMFTRWAYEDIDVMGHTFQRGDQVALLLAAANRDPGPWADPASFDPTRPVKPNATFGAGLHFCVGAPLARLELQTALPILFSRLPNLRLTGAPTYADVYHFHGLKRLMVQA